MHITFVRFFFRIKISRQSESYFCRRPRVRFILKMPKSVLKTAKNSVHAYEFILKMPKSVLKTAKNSVQAVFTTDFGIFSIDSV